ncbi:hypothetical protein C8D77_101270 [Mesorhizobium loti]|uniref:Uncharacterized protein n=1 Tax=Rhizobium loti TaxID=381 RepID=A0A8E3B675_RHILI|nr:hypothetical protein [Mesorhizobium loti]PWJ93591.1 hypothetical protein C8D77_101270 [Mesorhizobium loti]
MTGEALQIIGEIGHVRLEPGDVLIVTCPHAITREAHARIQQTVASIFAGHKVIVVDSGVRIEVAREAPPQKTTEETDYDMDRYSAR